MNLVVRLLLVLVGAFRGPRLGPLDESVVRFRVLPNDLDNNLHMNNGRYLTLMDLGRTDLVVRMGVVRRLLQRKWRPVVGSLTIRYRRSLEPFQRYELRTRLVAWDDDWFFVEQRFVRGGELVARAFVKGIFLGPEGRVPTQAVVDASGHGIASPPIPEGLRRWAEAEAMLNSEPTPEGADGRSG
jgi:acyl-CoA thioesterase FadM